MNSVVARLVVKDFYLNRWLITLALVAGVLSLVIIGSSQVGFSIGGIFYLTTVIAFGVVLVMYNIAQERKEKSLLFVLSLPLSASQYLQSKMLSTLGVFLVPWIVLTGGGVLMIALTPVPDGMISYFMLVSVFMLMNFCVVLSCALISTSEPVVSATIILTNLSVSLFFMMLAGIPDINQSPKHDFIRWTRPFSWVLCGEIAVLLFALALPFSVSRYRRNQI